MSAPFNHSFATTLCRYLELFVTPSGEGRSCGGLCAAADAPLFLLPCSAFPGGENLGVAQNARVPPRVVRYHQSALFYLIE
jgi:hypothetical protein